MLFRSILNEHKTAIGAISLVGPDVRLKLLDVEAVVKDLRTTVNDLFNTQVNGKN